MHIVCTMPALATYRAPMPVHVYPVATLLSLVTYTYQKLLRVFETILNLRING